MPRAFFSEVELKQCSYALNWL